GENGRNVAQRRIALRKGMERAGVLSSGKHFPGHGDTAVDSHKSLPIIDFSRERLDSIELYPYKKLINAGLSSVMVGHLSVPALEIKEGYPSSLSEQIIGDVLQEQLNFKGLVFTDALNMKGVSSFAKEGEVELSAFMAGNDILLMPLEVPKAKAKLLEAYNNGRITEDRLARSVKKILLAKYKVGLHNYTPIKMDNLYGDLNSLEDDMLYGEAMEHAVTVVKNNVSLLAIKNLENKKIAYVKDGDDNSDPFLKTLNEYAEVTQVNGKDIGTLKNKLKDYNIVIIGLHKSNESPWKAYKFTNTELNWLGEI